MMFFRKGKPAIMSTILDNIGNTPLVRLNRIPKSAGLQCEVCKLLINKDFLCTY